MNWSAHVRTLDKEGYTAQQVIEECNMPFITERFIINALRKPSTHNWASSTGRPFTPTGPKQKKIQEYLKEHPEEINTATSVELGKRIGVPDYIIRNYKRQNILGNKHFPKYVKNFRTYEKRLIHEGRMKAPEKQKTIQDIKNLW